MLRHSDVAAVGYGSGRRSGWGGPGLFPAQLRLCAAGVAADPFVGVGRALWDCASVQSVEVLRLSAGGAVTPFHFALTLALPGETLRRPGEGWFRLGQPVRLL